MISVSRGRCGLRKTEKIFSANNEQGTTTINDKTWRKVVSRKTLKKIYLENVRSESFSIRTFRARVAKGKPACRDRITRGKPRVKNGVSRGRCGLRKTEKIFSANNEQGTIKRGEKWFPEKL